MIDNNFEWQDMSNQMVTLSINIMCVISLWKSEKKLDSEKTVSVVSSTTFIQWVEQNINMKQMEDKRNPFSHQTVKSNGPSGKI